MIMIFYSTYEDEEVESVDEETGETVTDTVTNEISNSITFYIGSQTEAGDYYVRVNATDFTFVVSAEAIEAFELGDPEQYQ